MYLRHIFSSILATLLFVSGFNVNAQVKRSWWETLNVIRNDKLDMVLPKAMRDNAIDMWIHVMQQWRPDPMSADFGIFPPGFYGGYLVFTDRGGDRIERAVLGNDEGLLRRSGAYDIHGSEDDLRDFIVERDPKRIGVNMSDKISVANGLSYTGYFRLAETLGEKYAGRMVSAEKLIADFRSRRVASEIAFFAGVGELTRELLERALSNEVIIPGETTLGDVGWWVQDQMLARGVRSSFGFSKPGVIHSYSSGKNDFRDADYSIQRGDLLSFDLGVTMMNFGTDIKRQAYVLREGETGVPREFREAHEQALYVRDIIRENLKPGRTGVETLEFPYGKIEEAGFIRMEIEHNMTDTEIMEVNIGFHSVGNLGHDVGPAVWTGMPWRNSFILEPTNLFSFEFFAYPTMKEWGGKKAIIAIEDNAVLTVRGTEWLYPPNSGILLIK